MTVSLAFLFHQIAQFMKTLLLKPAIITLVSYLSKLVVLVHLIGHIIN